MLYLIEDGLTCKNNERDKQKQQARWERREKRPKCPKFSETDEWEAVTREQGMIWEV